MGALSFFGASVGKYNGCLEIYNATFIDLEIIKHQNHMALYPLRHW
jgi:hypothetical protein